MRRKKFRLSIIIILILFISIGFAVLTANLNMVANLSFRENTFDVHFENAEVLNSSNSINNSVTIDSNDTTSLSFTTTLTKPTDYIEFTFYVVNNGTIDAQLSNITTTLTTEQQNYITYNLTYDIDGSTVSANDYLYRGQARKIKAHFEYNYNVDSFYSGEALSTTITLRYIQPQSVTTTVWNYEYSGTNQYFIAPKTGTYKLEVWGSQGGVYSETVYGGYGGYSTGKVTLSKNDKLFVVVGGQGEVLVTNTSKYDAYGGYNGGGDTSSGKNDRIVTGGGGATHIALEKGELYELASKTDKVMIVAGGGSGAWKIINANYQEVLGHGGGYIGNSGETKNFGGYNELIVSGGTQNGPGALGQKFGSFGKAAVNISASGFCGAGGGWYGGNSKTYGAGGGSGYIGYTSMTDKIMYCYECQESTEEADETHIKTRRTTDVSATPTSNYAKMGNGFAKITFIG